MIDDADGSLMDLSKHRNVQRHLAEQVHIHDSISTTVSMYFELTPKPRLGSVNTNLKSIEQVCDDDSLTAFKIRAAKFKHGRLRKCIQTSEPIR